jgi:hypothetical protein
MPRGEPIRSLQCPNCHGTLLLTFEDWEGDIEGICVAVRDCPLLRCPICSYQILPDAGRAEVDHALRIAREEGKSEVTLRCPTEERRFRFSQDVNFLYDARDYLYIPGLWRPSNDGFLTPLFFNRSVLLKYRNSADYKLELFSNTYGSIRTTNHVISFGLNRQEQVLMWLGDVDRLPAEERHYLRSENVASTHDVASEFYDGQIDIVWSEPSREHALFDSRAEFVKRCQPLLAAPVMLLNAECSEILEGFRAPLIEDRRSVSNAIEDLCKVCVESINKAAFVNVLRSQTVAIDSKLGSLKIIEKWLETRVGAEAASIMSPLFVLYDLRINAAHLLSSERADTVLESARDRLGGATTDLIEIYRLLVSNVASCFRSLTAAIG